MTADPQQLNCMSAMQPAAAKVSKAHTFEGCGLRDSLEARSCHSGGPVRYQLTSFPIVTGMVRANGHFGADPAEARSTNNDHTCTEVAVGSDQSRNYREAGQLVPHWTA